MKFITQFSTKEILSAIVAIGVFTLGVTYFIGGEAQADAEIEKEAVAKQVTLININEQNDGTAVVASGMVEAVNEAEVVAEGSGVVRSLNVKIGQTVAAGTVLASLSGGDQAASVAQARAALDIQEAQLNDLLRNAPGSESATSDKILIAEQQEKNIKNAYRTLLNTDIRAYVGESQFGQDNGLTPTISGVYNSTEEGQYIIETYSSGAASGVSYRLKGMESGTFSADVNTPQPLGTKGLMIQFPNVDSNEITRQQWIVSVPNTRSASYITALNAYESAKEGKGIALQQTTVSAERIESQRASVRQAEANLQSSQAQLAKTSVRAPFAGTVLSVATNVGEFISTGQPVLTLVSESNQEIHVYVASEDAGTIQVGNTARINDVVEGVVSSKAPGIDAATGKVEIIVTPTEANDTLSIGEFVTVSIAGEKNDSAVLTLPLKAVRTTTGGSAVFVVNDGAVDAVPVTIGAMKGDKIEILSGLESVNSVIANVRGLTISELVVIN